MSNTRKNERRLQTSSIRSTKTKSRMNKSSTEHVKDTEPVRHGPSPGKTGRQVGMLEKPPPARRHQYVAYQWIPKKIKLSTYAEE